jgi:hypothetical protein
MRSFLFSHPKSRPLGGTSTPLIPPSLGGYLGALALRDIFEIEREELCCVAVLGTPCSGSGPGTPHDEKNRNECVGLQ